MLLGFLEKCSYGYLTNAPMVIGKMLHQQPSNYLVYSAFGRRQKPRTVGVEGEDADH